MVVGAIGMAVLGGSLYWALKASNEQWAGEDPPQSEAEMEHVVERRETEVEAQVASIKREAEPDVGHRPSGEGEKEVEPCPEHQQLGGWVVKQGDRVVSSCDYCDEGRPVEA